MTDYEKVVDAGEIDQLSLLKQWNPKMGLSLLGVKLGADMNSTADQGIKLIGGKKFLVKNIIVTNASVSLTTAADGDVNSEVSEGGVALGNQVAFSGLVNPEDYLDMAINTKTVTGKEVFFSLDTGQGALATADIYIYGFILA